VLVIGLTAFALWAVPLGGSLKCREVAGLAAVSARAVCSPLVVWCLSRACAEHRREPE
jgi:hypothetical protein